MKADCGLVSISFRALSPEDIIRITRAAGLSCIEWGSDVHAPPSDPVRLAEIAKLTKEAGLFTSSYGTYFYLGRNTPDELTPYIEAAKILGTDTLRLWCGTKGYADYSEEEREALFADCRAVAEMAEAAGVVLCMECHNNTFTDCREGTRALMAAVSSPSFLMYWQPNQFRTHEENVAYAEEVASVTRHLHVFHWLGHEKYPLSLGADRWAEYLPIFGEGHCLLLEFMPDGRPETLLREAKTLKGWIEA